jgi:hypothetical protein
VRSTTQRRGRIWKPLWREGLFWYTALIRHDSDIR